MIIDYDKELYLCIECAKESKLKKYIYNNKTKKHVCSFCHIENNVTLDIHNNPNFYNFMRALIRYHFWEDEYNRHFGGVTYLSEIFKGKNYFLHSDRIVDEIIMDSFTYNITDCNFDDPSIVELYYGHMDGTRWSFGERIKDKRNPDLDQLEKKLLKENYFLFENEIISAIKSFEEYFKSTILKKEIFYRARIGYSKKVKNENIWNMDKNRKYKYIPYKDAQISAPPSEKIQEGGRLNRQGISFLYLATDIDTALAEVRPHPGHNVSVGCFQCVKDLKIVDFDIAFIRLSENEETLKKFIYLNHIDQLLSRPITPEERHLYLITQFFADIFRKMGFDGISFTSSIGSGQNILIFNPSNFQYIEQDSAVHMIKSLNYESEQVT